ncbi:helix-turn-helix transcriptional regulator [Streptomyces sp. ME03-5709C]|nr:helix-turn-helix transcriptional regulator [Streptomyces sp. ME03-5709C]
MTHRKRGRPTRKLRHLPEAVTYAREQAGLTKRALAVAVGISEQLMSDIESGWRSATDDTLNRLAAELNCPRVVLEARREGAAGDRAVVSPS